jgi:ABC-2 type transport system ATP-binding protein
MTGPAHVIETEGLTKRFGDRVAVDGVELRVPRGAAFGYLGPNGAGKTTLIRMLLGLTPASSGTMRLLGLPVPEQRGRALSRIGAIVEEPRFHPFLTGRENLEIAAAVRGAEAQARIDGVLQRVGLTERADERVRSYSLGMRQRLGVGRALLADPELLLLDEPTNGLDPAGIHEFRDMIRGFIGEGRTVLLSSHLLDEVEKICDAVAIVDRGRVVVQGSIEDLKRSGERTVVIGTPDEHRAEAVLAGHAAVRSIERNGNGVRVTLASDLELTTEQAAGELNRRLTAQGIVVHKLDPESVSLEERFLQITERLGETE